AIIRIVSAVSLCGASLFPVLNFLTLFLQGEDLWKTVIPNTVFSLLIAGLTFYAHRENIVRLHAGTENFFGEKKQ
ncbi:MAG: glycerol-3-phosphate acyltransferase, partial [Clostridia bacterium]|nr:glycerol-3-phosphate acyltransferase [Clostridia bacterium]